MFGFFFNLQVVPELSPELAALNLNMEDLTQSAYDLRFISICIAVAKNIVHWTTSLVTPCPRNCQITKLNV